MESTISINLIIPLFLCYASQNFILFLVLDNTFWKKAMQVCSVFLTTAFLLLQQHLLNFSSSSCCRSSSFSLATSHNTYSFDQSLVFNFCNISSLGIQTSLNILTLNFFVSQFFQHFLPQHHFFFISLARNSALIFFWYSLASIISLVNRLRFHSFLAFLRSANAFSSSHNISRVPFLLPPCFLRASSIILYLRSASCNSGLARCFSLSTICLGFCVFSVASSFFLLPFTFNFQVLLTLNHGVSREFP